MSEPPADQPGRRASPLVSAGTLGTRVWDFISRLAALSREQARHDQQLRQLPQEVFGIAKDVQRLAGRMENIDSRIADQDRTVEAIIALKVREEVDKIRADLNRPPPATRD